MHYSQLVEFEHVRQLGNVSLQNLQTEFIVSVQVP